jgi:hypothetical protein
VQMTPSALRPRVWKYTAFIAVLLLGFYIAVLVGKKAGKKIYYYSRTPADKALIQTSEPRALLAHVATSIPGKPSLYIVRWNRPLLERLSPFLPTTDVGLPPLGAPGVLVYSVECPVWVQPVWFSERLLESLRRSTVFQGYSFDLLSEEKALAEIEKWRIERMIRRPSDVRSQAKDVRP